jgi:thymidylate kinase
MEALITITGPSCSGKTTLQNWLFGLGKFERIISFTTRPQREGEQPKVKTITSRPKMKSTSSEKLEKSLSLLLLAIIIMVYLEQN